MMWFQTRTVREQYLIGGAVALILILGLWQFIVKPVHNYKANAEQTQQIAQRDHSIVSRYAQQLSQAPQRVDRQPFDRLALVQLAAEANIPLSRMEPANDGSIEVQFENTSAPQVLLLLNRLEEKYALTISRLQITRRQGAAVSASVVLTPSQAAQ